MNKLTAFILILILGPLLGAIYGVLHDQLTFTISREYYTDFKFHQFGLVYKETDSISRNPRPLVTLVGIIATWWVGLIIGVVLAFVGLMQSSGSKMFKVTLKAFFLTLVIAFVVGIVGLGIGFLTFDQSLYPAWLPQYGLIMERNFHAVGSMHNFSYLGGLIGLVAAIIYSLKQKTK